MEDKTKLEEELEFLKESFDAEVISKGEYEKAKARIEAQLSSIEAKKEENPKKDPASKEKTAENIQEEVKTEEEKGGIKEEAPEVKVQKEEPKAEGKKEGLKVKEKKKEPVIKEEKKVKEVKKVSETQSVSDDAQKAKLSDKPKSKVKIKEEKKEEPALKEEKIEIKEIKEPSKIKESEEPRKEPEGIEEIDEKEKDTNDILNSRNGFPEKDTKKKISMWVPVVSGVLLLVIVYFSFLFLLNSGAGEKGINEIPPACFSDDNCLKEGMIGLCSNPGSQDAGCEFKEDAKINLLVLNTKDCFNCDISRVEKIIKKWFPGVIKREIELNSEEGAALAKDLSIELLPAFVFNSSLEEAFMYEELKSIFSKVDSSYILSPGASGSAYYISRGEIPNKLEVFLMKDDASTEKAEKNIEEFLKLFDGSVDYKKHIVDKGSSLIDELGINTFPTFLVNNKIRFSGVQPPEKIKDYFCKVNSLDKCSSKLSENLV